MARRRLTARSANLLELYELSVQAPEAEVDFLRRAYREHRGRLPRHLREDFCGTGLVAVEWAARGRRYTAEGFDIDPVPLRRGRTRHLPRLGEGAGRCVLHRKDAREPSDRPPDVRCALNYSYRVFRRRDELLAYARGALRDLAPEGILVLDTHGGSESYLEHEEEREVEAGFTYVWEQREYHPATGGYRCAIHFRFPDGSEIRDAFVYDWRFWTVPELADVLRDAGFRRVVSYWEGTAEDGETGNGVFTMDERGENCLAWNAYVVALK